MASNDILADVISKIENASKIFKSTLIVRRTKLVLNVLNVLKKYEYIKDFKEVEDGKQGLIEIKLGNTINKCKVIKPRFPVKSCDIEIQEKKFLPAKDFGIIIVSTNSGLLTQFEVKEKKLGGKLIAYCY